MNLQCYLCSEPAPLWMKVFAACANFSLSHRWTPAFAWPRLGRQIFTDQREKALPIGVSYACRAVVYTKAGANLWFPAALFLSSYHIRAIRVIRGGLLVAAPPRWGHVVRGRASDIGRPDVTRGLSKSRRKGFGYRDIDRAW